MTLVAGVDSSTQACKVVVHDLVTGEIVRTGRAPHPIGTEIDPEDWWAALYEAIAEAGGLADVAAIAIGGQQHGSVLLDKNGRVVRPAMLWNDTRSAQATLDLIAEFGPEAFVRRTGSVPVASFTATKLRWLRDNEPHHAASVAAVALPHDWLTWRLRGFGPANPALHELTTDRSDASGTSYWNPTTGEYDREILIAALGHDVILPRVLGAADRAGCVAGTDIVIGAGAGDNAAAALGLGASSGDVIISIGTSGTVFAVTDDPVRDVSGAVAGFADATGRYLPLIATLNAARILDVVADLLAVSHRALGEIAESVAPGSGGVVLHPYFEGERTPNLPDATATLFGMTLANTSRANLARAAIEGMLCGLAGGLDAVLSQSVKVRRILLIGGAAQNSSVQKIASEIFTYPISIPVTGEYVAAGAARQAGWALTGELPTWSTPIAPAHEPRVAPVIRAQYEAAQQ
ncbi:xylulokinase [Cryobacterium tagatosivorans]|uniref:Xylulose kinase n=1 Tax=Cryobacterium tagatosivorans TaxID=1259199 RepID=A0A4R8UGK1_9MICO|nr:xylulokinase [Cryobacterium tagatosivorans]TFB54418.1 xylulokinase [Cryobacterium tagatosivorans]